MKCLVTGGCGFIGSHVIDSLLREGYEVVVIDNLSTGRLENINHLEGNKNFEFINLDIRKKDEIEEVFSDKKFDYVFHLAAQMNVRESVKNPQNDAEINLLGLLNLLEASRKNNIKKFVFSSSGGAIYGDGVKIPTPEIEKEAPCSPYGIAKLCSEKYLFFYNKEYGLNYTALRYANVYGPRQNPKGEAGVVSIFISKIIDKENPVLNGSGNQTRDYVFVEDVVNANLLALKKDLKGIFNIGTGKETSVNEIFRKIKSIMNADFEEKHGPGLAGEQLRSCLSYEKIKNSCGWMPKNDLDSGLMETIDWFKKQNIYK